MIQFLLNQELKTERSLNPNMTVLTYLREQAHKPGTKEGCASGDCGACTVVVGELHSDADGEQTLRYRSLNSCLTFMVSLHGKQLISVEDLKHQGQLHSVQKAMVECHGSQCGFCTPGFVMSLFALQKNSSEADAHQAHEALAGNLCRCTGYRPILAAAEQSCAQRLPDQFDQRQAQTVERLRAIAPAGTDELNDGEKRCFIPLTVADLAGKKVAIWKGSFSQQLMLTALDKAGVARDAVDYRYLSALDSSHALDGGSVDAIATWEPYVTQQERQGARIIATAEGLIPAQSFIVANDQAIKDKRAQISDFLQRLQAARAWSVSDPQHNERYANAWSALTKADAEVARRWFSRAQVVVVPITAQVVAGAQQTIDFFNNAGLTKRYPAASVFDESFSAALADQAQAVR
ncbi:Ferredoxin:molybdopterin dehydrogenase, FAD-binding:-binding:CO dehydrogenase [Pseudomonas syringae pv. atrofaciens]|uniref:2Fe-2S iron-sulfur cluster-binding protein n=1 Tax=Pseudomonas syringae TaxID=317 RepID=UPI000EFE31D6|nr:2Fe-2S iron-sulfur cluster-binding protein [Pseudomonas syringae]RMP70255.1 Ferredoxin:molybdopterin dehydrogenase, FAD-binding:-binding:CO dehydrogenase [Pseudomonas syringae pv. atrofaciens]